MLTSGTMEDSPLAHIRHSLAHLLAKAILKLDPEAKLGTGPVTDTGFFYDFELSPEVEISDRDFKKIEKLMQNAVKENLSFDRREISLEEAEKIFKNQPYKLELARDFATNGEILTTYQTGDFLDLCKGGHVENTREIDPEAFALIRISGAYWKGDESRPQLTRITGIAFETKGDLEKYQHQQEEARKRDHKKLGKELKLFINSELVGAGLPLIAPKGMVIRKAIEDYLWDLQKEKGYDRVWTPHIAKEALYRTSGHASKFGDELFRVSGKEEKFFLKPMNCPHHMQIFANNSWSYRDMPVRYFEPATVYRDEKSGQLGGLTRVRSITQDDGHLFCRVSQLQEEVGAIISVVAEFYTTFNMTKEYWVSLSVRDKDHSKYLGDNAVWTAAENALESAATKNKLPYRRIEGEATFYGPKLDFMFKDSIGREWQLATIQCDFNLPERFDLSFINESGEEERPVVIHRAISGSLERFMGILIEHYAGAFPLWIAPVQIAVLPIGETHQEYAVQTKEALKKEGFRVEIHANESLGKRIRESKMQKVPYILVLGEKEVNEKSVSIESRDRGKLDSSTLPEFISRIQKERDDKSGNLWK